MTSDQNHRLYTFTANLYLSPLQCGLQSAHVVGNIAATMDHLELANFDSIRTSQAFHDWAHLDKTIIICAATNHAGVEACWAEIERINTALLLPAAIFHEDEDSMNGMATACGVVVPAKYWDTQFSKEESMWLDHPNGTRTKHVSAQAYWFHQDERGYETRYYLSHAEGQFINLIKSYRLA